MRSRRNPRAGNVMLEFTLIGIPLIFVLISTFEMARGMWLYHTLAFTVKEGARFAAVRGEHYIENSGRTPTVQEVAQRVRAMAVGLDPAEVTLTLQAGSPSSLLVHNCPGQSRLSDCLTDTSAWPPANHNLPGGHVVGVSASYPFRSAIAMVWPGTSGVAVFPMFNLPASSQEEIQF